MNQDQRPEPPLKLTKDEAALLERLAAHLDKTGQMMAPIDLNESIAEQATELDLLIAQVAYAGLTGGKPYTAVGNILRYLAKKGQTDEA